MEVPELTILHHETPSPFTPLGAKGVGEGNCMSTPVCIANAVADALGVEDVTLPLSPSKIAAFLAEDEPPARNPKRKAETSTPAGDRKLTGEGAADVAASREDVWRMLLDPATLDAIIPGSHGVRKLSETHFVADVTLGVGPVKGRYKADIELFDLDEPNAVTLRGKTTGALGFGGGEGRIMLTETAPGQTRIAYTYEAGIGGKVASVGGRLLDGAARVVIGQFFRALANHAGGGKPGVVARLKALIGRSA